MDHDWPGNVRELQNFVERSVILTSGRVLNPPVSGLFRKRIVVGPTALKECERENTLKAIRKAKWVIAGPHGAGRAPWRCPVDAHV